MECMKENKKRFFRKGGQSHRAQRSFDNHIGTGSNTCCRAPAPSLSIDSMSLASGTIVTTTPVHHHQQLMSNPNLQQAASGANRLVTVTSSPCPPPPGGKQQKQQQQQQQQQHTRGNTTNSGSLDEAEINMNCHRRFMPVPRRARSAERFDGMRVAYTGGGSGELAVLTRQATDDILSRSYRSPQILRTVENNGVGGGGTGNISSSTSGTRRQPPVVVANAKKPMDPTIYPVPSPPPSYTTAVNDAREPPPYHQAVAAAMKQPTSLRPQGKAALNNRYATSATVGPQSNSVTSTPTGNHGMGMRSVASTPIFASLDPVCCCHKCQIAERMPDHGCGTEYNDAVYMESQAYLMHEIMSDGIAFCSIM